MGAGAAGLMAAITAGRARLERSLTDGQCSIVLFDSRTKIGAKILISGGTRCNVTNKEVRPADYQGAPAHYLKHAFKAFTRVETMQFFKEIGVELVLEPSGKYFPDTHSGRTVLEKLLKELERVRVPLMAGQKITSIEKNQDHFELKTESGGTKARRVILATGGLSYPETGSDGTGLRIASAMGHAMQPTSPALTPLVSADEDWQALSGITVEARLTFFADGKKKAESRGSFLFAHFGFSGPAALDLSRHFAASGSKDRRIVANFFPDEDEASFSKKLKLARDSKQLPQNFLAQNFSIPVRLAETLLKKAPFTPALSRVPLNVTGVVGYKKAEATAGGVDLKNVHISTMESKLVPGLFFAGEILDVDGRIGGFNFQWAWSTGAIAGRAAMKGLG